MTTWTILEFDCPQCGMHVRNHYQDRDYVELAHDRMFLTIGALICANCENGVDASKDDYGVVPAPASGHASDGGSGEGA